MSAAQKNAPVTPVSSSVKKNETASDAGSNKASDVIQNLGQKAEAAFDGVVHDFLGGLEKQFETIGTSDWKAAATNVVGFIEKSFRERPFSMIGVGLGIGFGLNSLKSSHLKTGAIRLGKLYLVRSLSAAESATNKIINADSSTSNSSTNTSKGKVANA